MPLNCRMFLDNIATYGGSLYALVSGPFISRWVLAALGKANFGRHCRTCAAKTGNVTFFQWRRIPLYHVL